MFGKFSWAKFSNSNRIPHDWEICIKVKDSHADFATFAWFGSEICYVDLYFTKLLTVDNGP